MQPPNIARYNLDDIRRSLELICGPTWERGDVVELRALGTSKGTISAYFEHDHLELFVETAAKLSGCAHGVYITVNPVLSDCLARAANAAKLYAKNTTGDAEITQRHWLLIDTDPNRPSGISADQREHELALARATDIRAWLREERWPDPIFADSGNGGHLLYRIDLPPDDGKLVQQVLKALSDRFSDEAVAVDVKVHNPARISKLYGTLACKGTSLPNRPHRIARLLEMPDPVQVVSRELLESIIPKAAPVITARTVPQSNGSQWDSSAKSCNVVEYLQAHGIEVGKCKTLSEDATLWEISRCPWRPNETDGAPYVIQFANGNVAAGCHHNQCDGKGWDDLRDVIDSDWREREARKGSGKGPSVAQQIVTASANDEFFHTAEQDAYATVILGNQRETWRVKSSTYRLLLRRRVHEKGILANDSALDDALGILEGKSLFEGPQRSVHVRTAQAGDKLYLDLCNDAWEAVEISSDGWRVTSEVPVKFIRKQGMLPLPRPVAGGSVEQLRPFINVPDDGWLLVVSWLMAALRPNGPFPILVVNGEYGSCKTNTCERIRSMVDPNVAPLRGLPKDEQTLMIWANNSHVIALDNLSSFPQWLSDAMCRLSTGGGSSQRALYSDDAEKLFVAVRPQVINGIEDVATRSDFVDRSLTIHAPVLPKSARKTEADLDAEFAEAQPLILGALLTAAATGLKNLPHLKIDGVELPRLADFAMWMMAVESALGWHPGMFMREINRNEGDSHESAVVGSPVAETVRKFISVEKQWNGGWSELLAELNKVADDTPRRRDGWPTDTRTLSNKLRERAPNLRGVGIAVEFHDSKRPKQVSLHLVASATKGTGGSAFGGDCRYYSEPKLTCYDNDDFELETAALYKRLLRFWTAPPVAGITAAVAWPSLLTGFSDGAEVFCGE